MEALRRNGFDAAQGESLFVVPAPADRPQLAAGVCEELLPRIVFLPLYPEMPASAVRAMARTLRSRQDTLAAGRPEPEVLVTR